MTIERIEQIRQRAYELWVAEGRPKEKDIEFWLRAEHELADAQAAPMAVEGGAANEGEGNRTAARAFDREQTAFAQREDIAAMARQAEAALQGAEGDELRRAEQEGKSHSHGEHSALKADAAENGSVKPRRSRPKPTGKS